MVPCLVVPEVEEEIAKEDVDDGGVKDGAGSPVSEGEEKVYILAGAHQPGPRVVRVQHDEVGGADDVWK